MTLQSAKYLTARLVFPDIQADPSVKWFNCEDCPLKQKRICDGLEEEGTKVGTALIKMGMIHLGLLESVGEVEMQIVMTGNDVAKLKDFMAKGVNIARKRGAICLKKGSLRKLDKGID